MNCPLCDSESQPLFFDIRACPCGFVFSTKSIDQKGFDYPTKGTSSRTFKDYRRVLTKIPRGKLFEVGFGDCSFLKYAMLFGWAVCGIDINCKEERSYLKRKDFSTYTPKEKYNMVVMWDVIEHTLDPRGFIRKAHKMLLPNGVLVIATPDISGLLNKLADFLFKLGIKHPIKRLYVPEHVGYFSEWTLTKLMREEGFKTESFKTETDLARYKWNPFTKIGLKILFFFARILHLENRVVVIASKRS